MGQTLVICTRNWVREPVPKFITWCQIRVIGIHFFAPITDKTDENHASCSYCGESRLCNWIQHQPFVLLINRRTYAYLIS